MSWVIKEKGFWTCCSSFMKGGVPVFLRFTLTGGFSIGNWFFFINAVLTLCSHLCKSIITTQFFITNQKRKYFCGLWWNSTSAANNICTCVSYLVLSRVIPGMLQPVKYYYKSPFAASLDQKIHGFPSKVFLRVPGSQQSSHGWKGADLSFVVTASGGPIHEILHPRPWHLLFLPVLGESRLVLGGSEPSWRASLSIPGLCRTRAHTSPVWPGGESGPDTENWIRLIFKTEINWHLQQSNVLLFQLASFFFF